MDLAAAEQPGLHRIDVRELNTSLHSLARLPILSAFRYQRPSGTAAPTAGASRSSDLPMPACSRPRPIAPRPRR